MNESEEAEESCHWFRLALSLHQNTIHQMIGLVRQLSGLVVECQPAALKAGVQTQDGEPTNFQYRLSSGETKPPDNRIQHKAKGCLVLSVLC